MLPQITPELVMDNLEAYKEVIRSNKNQLEESIALMSKNALRDMLRCYMGIQISSELLEEPFVTKFTEKEQKAFSLSIKLQEDCLGYIALKKELQQGVSNE